ncbi:beta-mannosidase [Fontibacillus phaseoli]|uniref:Beta-mannosidase n=1 Tax=Fontibacillus phaseoli TaxID=1416533 RepID=A0A369B9L7_9BACL|nr:glycoside hydrolase family 2 protein [Fontibacillus phaseoli]RCX18229.1 beta-mannosidase [Fontibacillus phaseoli]
MSKQQQELNNWSFKACDETEWNTAHVPGTVHSDLLRQGKISDPFYGTNEHDLQWIDKKDWEYRSTFKLDGSWDACSHIELVFEGLDTYADVFLNGEHILSADNMFRAWSAEIKQLLVCDENVLNIVFRSPISEDLPKLEKLGYALPAANDQSELGGLGDRRISVFARKAPYHYGWDWGPRLVTSGIWRKVSLLGWSGPRLTDLFIRQDKVDAEVAKLTAMVEIETDADWRGNLAIAADGMSWQRGVALKQGRQTVELELELAEPRLWWCRGLGEPAMYEFSASLKDVDGKEVAERSIKTGLRQIRLICEKDAAGASFRFELNGVPVFAKGANHIPNDSFIPEVTTERYRHEIASAAESNMNMLRVWGGGLYEEDVFYDLCDKYGLLVWQDFMFACSMYPGDEAFLQSVAKEAEYNVKRLRNHPSIALWCGNNEMDSAWAHFDEEGGWGWKKNYTPEQREKIWSDYEAIFHKLLPEIVERLGGGVAYWPSSPMRVLTGDDRQHAIQVTGEGDVHYWGVWHSVEPFSNYNERVGRFMSEYGFQSFPELSSVLKYATEEQLELESEVMLAHQKNGRGNQLIKEYMEQYLPEPRDFKSFLYMSQVLQAEAIQTAIEAHRRNKPFCMGTLYWQMNDCWPVASWAGMDYYGRWKALQYIVRRSFREVMLSVDGSLAPGANLVIHAVSDLQEELQAKLRLALYDFDGKLLAEQLHNVNLGADSATVVHRLPSADLLDGHDRKSAVLHVSLEAGDGQVMANRHVYFERSRELVLPDAAITVTEVSGKGGSTFTLQADKLARQVWLQAEEEGIFTDNFFDLIPGQPVTVEFRRRGGSDSEAAFVLGSPGTLTVRSMRDFTI